MKRTIEQTGLLVALLLKRSGKKRARISEKTLRVLSKRTTLRDSFKDMLRSELDDLGIHMVQLNHRGGFGLIAVSALEGADPIKANQYLANELKMLRNSSDEGFKALRQEIEADEGEEDDE